MENEESKPKRKRKEMQAEIDRLKAELAVSTVLYDGLRDSYLALVRMKTYPTTQPYQYIPYWATWDTTSNPFPPNYSGSYNII